MNPRVQICSKKFETNVSSLQKVGSQIRTTIFSLDKQRLSINSVFNLFTFPDAHLLMVSLCSFICNHGAHLFVAPWCPPIDCPVMKTGQAVFVCVRSFSLARCLPAELFLSVDCVLWGAGGHLIARYTPTVHIFCTCKHRYTTITMDCHASKTMLFIHIGPNNSTQRMNIEQQDEIFYWLTGFFYNLTWYLVTFSVRSYVVSKNPDHKTE